MDELLDRLKAMEMEVSADRGPFWLFAVLLPADGVFNRWDIVVAAPWLHVRLQSYRLMTEEMFKRFTLDERMTIAKIVILEEYYPLLKAIRKAFRVEHGCIEFTNRQFENLDVEKGYIITSQDVSPAAVAKGDQQGEAE